MSKQKPQPVSKTPREWERQVYAHPVVVRAFLAMKAKEFGLCLKPE